jgi:hypothetical protein
MCALLATQISLSSFGASNASVKTDRAVVDAKKNGRYVRRHAKKAGRKITGQESKWEDFKDGAKDSVSNTKDEMKHAKKKAE